MSKRPYVIGALALSASLFLTACAGAGNETSNGPSTADSNAESAKLVAYNPQTVDKLDQGGTYTTTVGGLGPNFNPFSNPGYTSDVVASLAPADNTGCFTSTVDGTPVLNKDYCLDVKENITNGIQTVTYELNPKAKWNDGTPIDIKTFQAQWKALNGSNKAYDVPSTSGYDRITSVKQGKDAFEVIVELSKVYEPYTDLFSGFIHPAGDATPEIFNNGYVNTIRPEWRSGPFKLEKLDNTTKTLSYVPNDKWWGAKPVLSKIVFRAMDASATIPAFKNGEIDAVGASTLNRYKQLQNIPGTEIRRGQTLGVYGFIFNTTKGVLQDADVRKAMFMGTDREKLAAIQYSGLNWSEKLPGSWLSMPFAKNYSDNTNFKFDVAGAKKVLDDAGWVADSTGVRAKGGQPMSTSVTNYGDDPTGAAFVQSFQAQMKAIGIEVKIDQQPASAFSDYVGNKKFSITFSGNGVVSDAQIASGLDQFFTKDNPGNVTGAGTPEIDKMVQDAPSIVDLTERAAAANKVEKEFSGLHAMLPIINGPTIGFYKKGLANIGPSLFLTRDWTQVGWMKGSEHS